MKTVSQVINEYNARKGNIEYKRIVVSNGYDKHTYFDVSNIIKTKTMLSFYGCVAGQRPASLVRINDGLIILSEEV